MNTRVLNQKAAKAYEEIVPEAAKLGRFSEEQKSFNSDATRKQQGAARVAVARQESLIGSLKVIVERIQGGADTKVVDQLRTAS